MAGRRENRPRRGERAVKLVVMVLALGATARAQGPGATLRNAVRDGVDRVASNFHLSACAKGVLARHGLLGAALVEPEGAALRLERALGTMAGGEPDGPLALAELWYRAALRRPHHDPASAIPPLRAAAAAASLALAEPAAGCCDRAVEVHNDAVARLVRISQDGYASPGAEAGRTALAGLGVTFVAGDPLVDAGRFVGRGRLMTCASRGCGRSSGRAGWASRSSARAASTGPIRPRSTSRSSCPGFGSRRLCWPSPACGLARRCLPPRHRSAWPTADPFGVGSARVGARTSRWRPTARPSSRCRRRLPDRGQQAVLGVLASDVRAGCVQPGLYMLRPYASRGKIPVVFGPRPQLEPGSVRPGGSTFSRTTR